MKYDCWKGLLRLHQSELTVRFGLSEHYAQYSCTTDSVSTDIACIRTEKNLP